MKIDIKQNKLEIQVGDIVNYKGELCFVIKSYCVKCAEYVYTLLPMDRFEVIRKTFTLAELKSDCILVLKNSNVRISELEEQEAISKR